MGLKRQLSHFATGRRTSAACRVDGRIARRGSSCWKLAGNTITNHDLCLIFEPRNHASRQVKTLLSAETHELAKKIGCYKVALTKIVKENTLQWLQYNFIKHQTDQATSKRCTRHMKLYGSSHRGSGIVLDEGLQASRRLRVHLGAVLRNGGMLREKRGD